MTETPSGSCEKAGGGEWTALRERLIAKAKEWRRRERHAGSPGEACVYPFLADELEALAAAAPAPPATFNEEEVFQLLKGRFAVQGNKVAWMTEQLNKLMEVKRKEAAQDGQGAELLGPPRGGSSSDLADPAHLSAALRAEQALHAKVVESVRRFPLGHEHWDRTMRRGAGCELCIQQQAYKEELMKLLTEAPENVLPEAVAGNASGPPRGGSSSDLADSNSLKVGDEVWVRAKVMQFIEPEHNGVEILLEIGRNELMRTWCNASDLRRME